MMKSRPELSNIAFSLYHSGAIRQFFGLVYEPVAPAFLSGMVSIVSIAPKTKVK